MAAWKMRGVSMADDRPLLLGCGILHKEVRLLIEKNNWPLDTFLWTPYCMSISVLWPQASSQRWPATPDAGI